MYVCMCTRIIFFQIRQSDSVHGASSEPNKKNKYIDRYFIYSALIRSEPTTRRALYKIGGANASSSVRRLLFICVLHQRELCFRLMVARRGRGRRREGERELDLKTPFKTKTQRKHRPRINYHKESSARTYQRVWYTEAYAASEPVIVICTRPTNT